MTKLATLLEQFLKNPNSAPPATTGSRRTALLSPFPHAICKDVAHSTVLMTACTSNVTFLAVKLWTAHKSRKFEERRQPISGHKIKVQL
jgi:hypothetical protein